MANAPITGGGVAGLTISIEQPAQEELKRRTALIRIGTILGAKVDGFALNQSKGFFNEATLKMLLKEVGEFVAPHTGEAVWVKKFEDYI